MPRSQALRGHPSKAKDDWARTPWEAQRSNNFCFLDGQVDEDHQVQDGCGICGVPKTQCMKQDEHFGAQGESTPYVKCTVCKLKFCNFYNSAHELELHMAESHPAKMSKQNRQNVVYSASAQSECAPTLNPKP